jgi:hypothetical protein
VPGGQQRVVSSGAGALFKLFCCSFSGLWLSERALILQVNILDHCRLNRSASGQEIPALKKQIFREK